MEQGVEHMEQPRKVPDMRTQMPTVTAWVNTLRDVFGKDEINDCIRAGLAGKGIFYASENGHIIGALFLGNPAKCISVADMNIPTQEERAMLEKASKRFKK